MHRAQLAAYGGAAARVEGAERFVEEQDRRSHRQRARERPDAHAEAANVDHAPPAPGCAPAAPRAGSSARSSVSGASARIASTAATGSASASPKEVKRS